MVRLDTGQGQLLIHIPRTGESKPVKLGEEAFTRAFFPVEFDGQPAHFCLVNVTRLARCIDDGASAEVE